jgi:peptidoglycan hydrolase FlgJ
MRVPDPLASDVRSLDALKNGAGRDPKGAVRQAATQFEALFMQMVMKSMRDSVPKSGMLEGSGSDVFQGMLDTQFSQAMTGRPGGLSDLIAKQLMRSMRIDDPATPPTAPKVSVDGLSRALMAAESAGRGQSEADEILPSGAARMAEAAAAAAAAARSRQVGDTAVRRDAATGMPVLGATPPAAAAPAAGGSARPGGAPGAFVDRMWGAASAAEQATGVPAGFIVGQAALESGWGRHEMRHADGRPAHNLFGIKAGPGWRGDTVEATTTEYVDGKAVKSVERFRAYASYQESFADWARLMASNPRYAGVMQSGGSVESLARQLQRAGYATDPEYASKLTRTITQALSMRRVNT